MAGSTSTNSTIMPEDSVSNYRVHLDSQAEAVTCSEMLEGSSLSRHAIRKSVRSSNLRDDFVGTQFRVQGENNKDFLVLCARRPLNDMKTSEEFAYNAMIGNDPGARVTPRCQPALNVLTNRLRETQLSAFEAENIVEDEEAPAHVATFDDYATTMSGLKPNIKATTDSIGRPRKELVLNHRYDDGDTPNHYKGEYGLANFGYVKVNGQWADPDSEASLANAFKGVPDPSTQVLPGATDTGPRILSPKKLKMLYAECDEYLSDDEGPMGSFRISPASFALLAQGCGSRGKGNSWATAIPAPQERFTDRERKPRANKFPWEADAQVCNDTGSLMSGVEDHDGTASLLVSEAGVNLSKKPEGFSRMAPQTDLEMLAAAFGCFNPYKAAEAPADNGPPQANQLDTSGLLRALNIPEGPEGIEMLEDFRKGIEYVRSMTLTKNKDAVDAANKRFAACHRMSNLIKELHWLRSYLERHPQRFPEALAAAKLHQPESKPTPPFAPPPGDYEKAKASIDPQFVEELPPDLGQRDIMYLRMIEDTIQCENLLAKHFEYLAETWNIETSEIQAKIDHLLTVKETLKELSGLKDEHIAYLVPCTEGMEQRPKIF